MVNPYQPPGAELEAQAQVAAGAYEFGEVENLNIARAAEFSRIWGVMALVIGVLMLLMMLGGIFFTVAMASEMDDLAAAVVLIIVVAVMTAPLAFVFLATGGHYISSGRALREVVETSGNDVGLLMNALETLARAFRVEMIVIIAVSSAMVLLNVAAVFADAIFPSAGG
jgi:hypothetical protein